MKKIFINLIILHLFIIPSYNQDQFLISIDPVSGEHTKIGIIEGVTNLINSGTSAFNEKKHHYTFIGMIQGDGLCLITVDVNSGEILYKPGLSTVLTGYDHISGLNYDNNLDSLFALFWKDSEVRWYFSSVDPGTAGIKIYDSIPELIAVEEHQTNYDQKNHRYIFKGWEKNDSAFLYTINAFDGSLISRVHFPDSNFVGSLQFSDSTSILYGLHYNMENQTEHLVSVDIADGKVDQIAYIPDVLFISGFSYHTIDQVNDLYYFRGGRETESTMRLYAINFKSGEIVSDPYFPIYDDESDFIHELEYDNTTGTMYALHWDAYTILNTERDKEDSQLFIIYPNPAKNDIVVYPYGVFDNTEIIINNIYGQIVKKETIKNNMQIILKRDHFSNGIYFISVFYNGVRAGSQMIVFD